SFGFTAAQTSTGTNASAGGGSVATTTTAKGILDTETDSYTGFNNGTRYSVTSFNISNLVGTDGDANLSKIIDMVDKAIAKVTDAGTKLGANKTQIDGQKTFVDTLMKANDRTIGILVDADIEEESTKLKALQTQQQLAVQALSIANSSSQNVLSLFR
ncbi:flagellin, partial [Methylobacterium frigidaeris]